MISDFSKVNPGPSFLINDFQLDQDDFLSLNLGADFLPVYRMPGQWVNNRYIENGVALSPTDVSNAKNTGREYQYYLFTHEGNQPGSLNSLSFQKVYSKWIVNHSSDQVLLMMKIAGYPLTAESIKTIPWEGLRVQAIKSVSDFSAAERAGLVAKSAADAAGKRNQLLAYIVPAVGLAAFGFFL